MRAKNSLLIHLDELFERDTDFSLHMVYLDEPALGIVPVTGNPLPANPVPPAPDGNRLLALIAQREYGPEADALLYRLLKQVSAREEGSVFSLLTLLQLWKNARQEDFPEPLWRRVKSTILGYRYWHDERGCDAMDFWGENAPVFHAAQMQAGALFPDERFIASSPLWPSTAAAGWNAPERSQRMNKEQLMSTLEARGAWFLSPEKS